MAGALFENMVMQETIKFFYNKGIRPDLYYLRTSNGLEVDLLIEQGNKLYPFEIKMTKSPKINMAKPLHNFMELFSQWEIQNGTIISMADESVQLTRTVEVKSFKEYLDSLNEISN